MGRIVVLGFLFIIQSNAMAIKVSDFKAGLACTDGRSFGWVCHKTTEIYITGQGQCISNRKSVPCTWYGFSFKYNNYKLGTKIKCKHYSSVPVSFGNPKSVSKKNVKFIKFNIELKKPSGEYYHPQYSVLAKPPKGVNVRKARTECTYKGEKLFDFKFNFHLPN